MEKSQIETICSECGHKYIIDRDQVKGIHYICPECKAKIPLYREFLIIDKDNYQKIIRDNKGLLIILFTAEWSQPSKNFEIPMKNLSREFFKRLRIGIYDISNCEEHIKELNIFSIPTVYFFLDDQLSEKIEGYYTEEELRSVIERII